MQPTKRPRFRLLSFSLRQLMLATAFVAVGCYALRWASPWWSIVLFYAGIVLIVGGILVVINRRGETRSFWAGFAICGILHMLLVFRPGLENGIPALHPGAFATTWASAYTYNRIEPQLTVKPIPTDPAVLGTIRGRWGGTGIFPSGPPTHSAAQAAHTGTFPAPRRPPSTPAKTATSN